MLFLSDYLPVMASFTGMVYFMCQAYLKAQDPDDKYNIKALLYVVGCVLCSAGAVVAAGHLDFLHDLEPLAVCETDLECEMWESSKGAK